MKINEKYILVFSIEGRILTFTGKIINEDDRFVTFKDKYDKVLTYNKNNLVSFTELTQ